MGCWLLEVVCMAAAFISRDPGLTAYCQLLHLKNPLGGRRTQELRHRSHFGQGQRRQRRAIFAIGSRQASSAAAPAAETETALLMGCWKLEVVCMVAAFISRDPGQKKQKQLCDFHFHFHFHCVPLPPGARNHEPGRYKA
jgi:hypothetical protein